MLRSMNVSDLDRVLEINAANVPDVGEADAAHLRHLFEQSSIALVCEGDSTATETTTGAAAEIAGFCIVFAPGADYDSINYQWFSTHHPGSMYLDRVAFDARFHGQGLGTTMYAEVERIIAADHPGTTEFTLEVNVDPPNVPSLAFHRKLGFNEVGRQMSHGIEVSLMARQL